MKSTGKWVVVQHIMDDGAILEVDSVLGVYGSKAEAEDIIQMITDSREPEDTEMFEMVPEQIMIPD